MLTVIAPAKRLDMDRTARAPRPTQPRLLDDAERLVTVLRRKSAADLRKLMNIGDDLAALNRDRYKSWERPFTASNAARAILAFDGDVFANMTRDEYEPDDFAFAQGHLRILSGLYGVLRPLDLIQPYRLEMGTKLKVDSARDLYAFWDDAITDLLRRDAKRVKAGALVNLASDEYFGAVDPDTLGIPVIRPVFKEKRNGAYKVIAFNAKRARGAMVDHIIRERITEPKDLKAFRGQDYRYDNKLSDDSTWVFTRG